jgi:hypothetical protein
VHNNIHHSKIENKPQPRKSKETSPPSSTAILKSTTDDSMNEEKTTISKTKKNDEISSKTNDLNSKKPGTWYWKNDNKEWVAYSDEVNKKLEQAWNSVGTNIVNIDLQRFVNIKLMEQIRYDDTTKRREVTRDNKH